MKMHSFILTLCMSWVCAEDSLANLKPFTAGGMYERDGKQ